MKTLLILASILVSSFHVQAESKPKTKTEIKEIEWQTLSKLVVPSYEESKKGKKPIAAKEIKDILGQEIVIKGFMMPLDFSSKEVSEFLLMPYVPSCMHVPPPPSNNLIVVKMAKDSKMKATFYPVEVKGVLELEENIEFESSYKLAAQTVVELDPKRLNEDDKKKLEGSTPSVNHNGGR